MAEKGAEVRVSYFSYEGFRPEKLRVENGSETPSEPRQKPDVVSIILPRTVEKYEDLRRKIVRAMNVEKFGLVRLENTDSLIFHSEAVKVLESEVVDFSSTSPGSSGRKNLSVVLFEKSEGYGPRAKMYGFWFCSSQLEVGGSGNGHRAAQISEVGNIFGEKKRRELPVIFAGDTQIPRWQESALSPPPNFQDAWTFAGKEENRKTRGDDRPDQIWFSGANLEILDFGSGGERNISATFRLQSLV